MIRIMAEAMRGEIDTVNSANLSRRSLHNNIGFVNLMEISWNASWFVRIPFWDVLSNEAPLVKYEHGTRLEQLFEKCCE